MTNFNILTLFPDIVETFFNCSILKKAVEKGLITYNVLNFRDYSEDKHKAVDDIPFGGGYGMVIKPEPVINALSSLKNESGSGKVILMSARGNLFNQKKAEYLSKEKNITLICGRYEGVDERITHFIDDELSIGNFVLMGGELAACSVIEAVARLIPGVIGKMDSVNEESFSGHLLEYPQYTRPREFKGFKVPQVLISGNHKEIEKWRKKQQVETTVKRRMDLIESREEALNRFEVEGVKEYLGEKEIYVALIHFPVYNKKKEIVATATTNMDIHDISRVAKTYSIKKYFIVTPVEGQKQYINRIIKHWREGYGYQYNNNRAKALSITYVTESMESCLSEIKNATSKEVVTVGTSASGSRDNIITVSALKKILETKALLLVFGTGWGLTENIIKQFNYMLEPIYGIDNFNHLPVRSAVSITLDRILGF